MHLNAFGLLKCNYDSFNLYLTMKHYFAFLHVNSLAHWWLFITFILTTLSLFYLFFRNSSDTGRYPIQNWPVGMRMMPTACLMISTIIISSVAVAMCPEGEWLMMSRACVSTYFALLFPYFKYWKLVHDLCFVKWLYAFKDEQVERSKLME